MDNPTGVGWSPVVLEPNAPGKVQTLLHHRHGIEAVCAACEILTLRARVRELEEELCAVRDLLEKALGLRTAGGSG